MIVSLILASILVVTGVVLYLLDLRHRADEATTEQSVQVEEGCCGMHITCEKDSLLATVSEEIVYYDDEELDAYRGRAADGYTDTEIEQFRDVLLTLLPDDIAGWGRSLQLRGINLPEAVRDELLLIVAETRASRATA